MGNVFNVVELNVVVVVNIAVECGIIRWDLVGSGGLLLFSHFDIAVVGLLRVVGQTLFSGGLS